MPIITAVPLLGGAAYTHAPADANWSEPTLFRSAISWNVTQARRGHIIQHIQRSEKYWVQRIHPSGSPRQTWQVISRDDYWELWDVAVGPGDVGIVTPSIGQIHDKFTLPVGLATDDPPAKNGTIGKWKILGTVYWVDEGGIDANWWPGNATPPNARAARSAGRLRSRMAKPVQGDGLARRGQLGRVVLYRRHAGEWDWATEVPAPRAQAVTLDAAARRARSQLAETVRVPAALHYTATPTVCRTRALASSAYRFRSASVSTVEEAGGWLDISRRPARLA